MARIAETELYGPIKAFLEAQGYEVKSEIRAADVVACRRDAPDDPPVIVELKTGFSLALLHQAVARLALCDAVYVAVPRSTGKAGWKALQANIKLCRRLGLGVLTVRLRDGLVEAHADPGPYAPRKSPRRQQALLREFQRRRGDPNRGGSPAMGGVVTAYRQDALACARVLADQGATKGAEVARLSGVPTATRLMRDNHYGWFERLGTGIYDLAAEGAAAVTAAAQTRPDQAG